MYAADKVFERSICNYRIAGETVLTTLSFNKEDSDTITDANESYASPKSVKQKLKAFALLDDLVIFKDNEDLAVSRDNYGHNPVQKARPNISPVKPLDFSSPRPISELDAAATKLQKVYKSYRTRRNLADCAVVIEELWWKALDFASLRQSSVSFFDIDKHESAVSRWARARTRAAKVGKGLSKNEKAQKLALQHWLEAIDPRHRYGHNLRFYYEIWSGSKSSQPFFYWLDIGDGKELSVTKCPRVDLQHQCIDYLGPKEREAYEVIVVNGKLAYKQFGSYLNTVEGSKWIFVLSTSWNLYVGQKKKGVFQHSSFLSGGATTAAGRLVAHNGILEAIWPYSGHYLPTEDNFKEFIRFLEEHHVDLANVKRCAVDDDRTSLGSTDKGPKTNNGEGPAPLLDSDVVTVNQPVNEGPAKVVDNNKGSTAINKENEASKFELTKCLSHKWTSGVGPRIGCFRVYPLELQTQALDKVLTPKAAPLNSKSFNPIPSPRPSPRILVSPTLAYMGFPSPRVSLPVSS